MKKLMAVAGACLLAACNSGTVTGPDPVDTVTQAPEPVAAATPALQPVVPPPSAQHDARVKGGFYSVTNETSVPQFYCAAAFGVLPGGEQGAGTNLYEDQGIRQPKDVFSGQAPKTAACQYKQIQVDLTQSKDCRNFDWHNVLAAEVHNNPNYIEGSKKVLVNESEAGSWSAYTEYGEWGAWSQEGCGTRTRTRTRTRDFFKVEKFECSGEIVRTKIRIETETDTDTDTKSCCQYSQPSFSITINDPVYTPYSAAVSYSPAYFYYNFASSSDATKNFCTGNGGSLVPPYRELGGVWIGNYDQGHQHTCRTTNDYGSSVGISGQKFHSTPVVQARAEVQEALGPITTTATFSGAGTWLLRMNATGYTNGEKGQKEEILTCNSAPKTISVSYDWLNHGAEQWYGNLRLNGSVVATSATRNNPSN